jgi:hypothetical protein
MRHKSTLFNISYISLEQIPQKLLNKLVSKKQCSTTEIILEDSKDNTRKTSLQ